MTYESMKKGMDGLRDDLGYEPLGESDEAHESNSPSEQYLNQNDKTYAQSTDSEGDLYATQQALDERKDGSSHSDLDKLESKFGDLEASRETLEANSQHTGIEDAIEAASSYVKDIESGRKSEQTSEKPISETTENK